MLLKKKQKNCQIFNNWAYSRILPYIFVWFFIVFPGGVISTYIFQGLGKGTMSVIFTIIREVLCATVFAILFGIVLCCGINGVGLEY